MGQSESCECGPRTADLHEKEIVEDDESEEGEGDDDEEEIPYNKPKTEHYQRGFKTFMSICSDDHRAVAAWLAPRIAQLQHSEAAQRPINILSVGAGVGRLDSLLLRSLHVPPARYVAVEMNAQYTTNLKQALRKVERAGKVKSTTVVVESGFEDMKTTEEFDVIIISHALSYMKNQDRIIRRALSLIRDNNGLIFCMAGLNQLLTIAPKYNPKYKPNRNSLDGPKLHQFLEDIRNSGNAKDASSLSTMFSLESGQTDSYMDMGKFAALSHDDKHDVMTMMLQNDTRFFSSELIEQFEADLASQSTRRQATGTNGSPLTSPVSSPIPGSESPSTTAASGEVMGRPCGSAMFMLVLPYTTPSVVWTPTVGLAMPAIPPPTPRAARSVGLTASMTPSSAQRALLPSNITANTSHHQRNNSSPSGKPANIGEQKNDSSPDSTPMSSPAATVTTIVATKTQPTTATASGASPSLRGYTGVSVHGKSAGGPSVLRLDQSAPSPSSSQAGAGATTSTVGASPSMPVRTLSVVTGASAATTPVTSPDNTPKGGVQPTAVAHNKHVGHNSNNNKSSMTSTKVVAPVTDHEDDDDAAAPWE